MNTCGPAAGPLNSYTRQRGFSQVVWQSGVATHAKTKLLLWTLENKKGKTLCINALQYVYWSNICLNFLFIRYFNAEWSSLLWNIWADWMGSLLDLRATTSSWSVTLKLNRWKKVCFPSPIMVRRAVGPNPNTISLNHNLSCGNGFKGYLQNWKAVTNYFCMKGQSQRR